MRDIEFRGKRTDNGEWVYGYYYKAKYYRTDDELCDYITVPHPNEYNVPSSKYVVDPSTVGQYTGLKDKNGTKIFEGDILKGFNYPYKHEEEFNYFAEVLWFENSPAFGIYTFKNPKSEVSGISEGNTDYMEDWIPNSWEVIGNIYDNPELLGGE
mgnify:CR=1 FL=1